MQEVFKFVFLLLRFQLQNVRKKHKCDFNSINVAELKIYLQEPGVSVSGYLKTSFVEIAYAVERMVLPGDPNIEKIKPLMLMI